MPTPSLALVGATALLGEDLRAVEDCVVAIDGRTIAAAGAAADVPAEARRVEDVSGSLLVPGFVDAHVHARFHEPRAIVSRGVTTVRDLGWPPGEIFALARASGADGFAGPRIVAAGAILTAPGGYPTRAAWAPPGTGLEVDEGGAGPAVEAMARRGACVVKVALDPRVGPVLDGATLGAIARAAHARGLRVTAHVAGLEELDKALDAGVDELAHMLLTPDAIPAATIQRMVARGMAVVPTLAIFSGRGRAVAVDNLGRFLARGGRVAYGTDLGNEGPRPGIDPREVEGMLDAGMTPLDVVRSATATSARVLGLRGAGAIAPGRDADLVALPPDALRSGQLGAVRRTWRRGRSFDPR